MKTTSFEKRPVHEAINNKAEQRKIQIQYFGKMFGINPYYIFADIRPMPIIEKGHDWMNN